MLGIFSRIFSNGLDRCPRTSNVIEICFHSHELGNGLSGGGIVAQFVEWVEPKAIPIIRGGQAMMGIAALSPSYESGRALSMLSQPFRFPSSHKRSELVVLPGLAQVG